MATLTVGAGQQYSTIAAAAAASGSGDTVDVQAGTYTNDFVTIDHDLTLNAVGGTVKLVATAQPPDGKAIIDEGGAGVRVTIAGFDMSGASVRDGNGAAIRYEGGALALRGDTIHDNQEGLLAAADPAGSITVTGSTFAHNGTGTGYTHNLYAGPIASLAVRDSSFSGAVAGHDIKSRAASTTIVGNTITDGSTGNASYEIDLPNGGAAVVSGNVIQKGPHAQNPVAISYGEEGGLYGASSLAVQGNTILNDHPSPSATAVANASAATAAIGGNRLYGWSAVSSGPTSLAGNAILTSEPLLSSLAPAGASGAVGAVAAASGAVAATGTAVTSAPVPSGVTPASAVTTGSGAGTAAAAAANVSSTQVAGQGVPTPAPAGSVTDLASIQGPSTPATSAPLANQAVPPTTTGALPPAAATGSHPKAAGAVPVTASTLGDAQQPAFLTSTDLLRGTGTLSRPASTWPASDLVQAGAQWQPAVFHPASAPATPTLQTPDAPSAAALIDNAGQAWTPPPLYQQQA